MKYDDVRGITVKIERRDSNPTSLAKPSFFDALQHVSSPFERRPLPDSTYQNYPLCQLVTLSFFEKGAKTSINYDPHKEVITIEESSEEYQLDKGRALNAILEHIMIDHGKHHSFFINNLSGKTVKSGAIL
ncbi:hypothetical protein ABE28_022650 [Peribacillus muralis]|uniref:Uncharacterized protein n=2 Tax=Peribacillus muralis TaxID=264697 RepID=A0A1B3XVB6_9BACI|nr:hypothetical protein [Peribacillus muralis]AOH57154.1 hypothetical protein ABE28_022650 [Peribacillus muralis]